MDERHRQFFADWEKRDREHFARLRRDIDVTFGSYVAVLVLAIVIIAAARFAA